MAYRKENLVALMYINEGSSTKVVPVNHEDFSKEKVEMDLEVGTWTPPRRGLVNPKITKIGERVWGRGNIIGIFDRSEPEQLNEMIRGVQLVMEYNHTKKPLYKLISERLFN